MLKEKELSADKGATNEKCRLICMSAAVLLGKYGEPKERAVFAGRGKNGKDEMEIGGQIKLISCYITPEIGENDVFFRISQNVVGMGKQARIAEGFVVETKVEDARLEKDGTEHQDGDWRVCFRSSNGSEIINSSGERASREELRDYNKLLDGMMAIYYQRQLSQQEQVS